MTYTQPSGDPANTGTLTGLFNEVFGKLLMDLENKLPARVVSYNRTTNRAVIQPMISIVKTNGEIMPRSQLASIPVFQYGGGGFVMSFPLVPGDLGWINACDTDISLFLQSLAMSAPNMKRPHSFSNGEFVPARLASFVVNSEDEGNAVLSSVDGTVRIAIWPNKVKITAPTVLIDSPQTTCTGNLTVEGLLTYEAGMVGSGGTTAAAITGDITVTGEVTASGTALHTHRHGGVTTGGGTTGAPV